MKVSKKALQKIIKEEKQLYLEQLTMANRARGLLIDNVKAERVKQILSIMYDEAVNDAIAEEGLETDEAEEMAIRGVTEVFGEFLDSVGFRYMLADLD
tara:strand:+ start:6606 stop:6899 length:294 start_codon:yes stop_codon:yes gene_type:complete